MQPNSASPLEAPFNFDAQDDRGAALLASWTAGLAHDNSREGRVSALCLHTFSFGPQSALHWAENTTMEKSFESSAEKLSQTAKDKLSDLAQSAAERFERGRAGTADTLESAASAVRTKGGEAGAAITDMSSKAATNLDASARYVRSADCRQVCSDIGALARQHPGAIALGAIVAGFCLGRMMTRHSCCTHVKDA
jgi:hypothetical protein